MLPHGREEAMLIRPNSLPDEQDHGYLGRVMRLNGVNKEKDMDVLLRAWAGVPGSNYRDVSCVSLLSRLANMPVSEFVVHHTSQPLRRGITSYLPDLRHGCESNPQMLCSTSMRLARGGAYFCEHCVQEDLAFHGQSYWRREHQIPGLFWCRKHLVLLRYAEHASAFFRPPTTLMGTATPLANDWAIEAMLNRVVNRYLDICGELLGREAPLDVRYVSLVLRERARGQGYQVNSGAIRLPLLSDRALGEFGRSWLSTVLPALAVKETGALCFPLDGVFFMQKSASSTVAYALVCALLYETADEALNALVEGSPSRERPRRKRMLDITPEDLLAAYVHARGDWGKAAENFDCVYQTITNRYSALGLPNLAGRRKKKPFNALFAFYAEERSFSESAAIGGLRATKCQSDSFI